MLIEFYTFRVSPEFFSNRTVTVNCKHSQASSNKELTIEMNDNRTDVCMHSTFGMYFHDRSSLPRNWMGYLDLYKDSSFVLNPVIITTDDNAKALSPQT